MATPQPKTRISRDTPIPPDIPNIFSAAENNDVRALEVALEHYDVNTPDAIGMRPLHYAASTLSRRTAERLLGHPEIDASLADDFGRSAATVALECWGDLAEGMLELLQPRCYPWLFDGP